MSTFYTSLRVSLRESLRVSLHRYGLAAQTALTRDLHLGVDLCAPIGAAVHAFADGEIFLTGYYPDEFDYGYVVVTKHRIGGKDVWALHGHLSAGSIEGPGKKAGTSIVKGEVIGHMGGKSENGNWFPHTHFQLVLLEPVIADCPGVVAVQDRKTCHKIYPDPRLVLGPLWPLPAESAFAAGTDDVRVSRTHVNRTDGGSTSGSAKGSAGGNESKSDESKSRVAGIGGAGGGGGGTDDGDSDGGCGGGGGGSGDCDSAVPLPGDLVTSLVYGTMVQSLVRHCFHADAQLYCIAKVDWVVGQGNLELGGGIV